MGDPRLARRAEPTAVTEHQAPHAGVLVATDPTEQEPGLEIHPGGTASEATPPSPVTFYFDLGSPYSYLAAERISRLFADAGLVQPEWRPVLLGGLFARFGRASWGNGSGRSAGMREVERRADAMGIQPIRWPDPWPPNTLYAMRVATYAKTVGRTVSFAQAAFRQAFAGGRDLTDPDNVAIAAAACELHPNAIAKAATSASVKSRLRAATEDAGDRGVSGVPSVLVGTVVFWGDDRLEEAVAAAQLQPS